MLLLWVIQILKLLHFLKHCLFLLYKPLIFDAKQTQLFCNLKTLSLATTPSYRWFLRSIRSGIVVDIVLMFVLVIVLKLRFNNFLDLHWNATYFINWHGLLIYLSQSRALLDRLDLLNFFDVIVMIWNFTLAFIISLY